MVVAQFRRYPCTFDHENNRSALQAVFMDDILAPLPCLPCAIHYHQFEIGSPEEQQFLRWREVVREHERED